MRTELELEYPDDDDFIAALEGLSFSASRFRHRDHVRMAWAYATRFGPDETEARISHGIRRLARTAGAERKYHETLTRAWARAVRHFASQQRQWQTFGDFVGRFPQLLRGDLLLAHYNADTLFSPEARSGWVAPDKSPIP